MSPITFTIHELPQPAQRSLLAELSWGSPGGLRYQILDEIAWDRLPEGSRSILAHHNDRVVGCYVLAPQDWGVLRLLLAVHPDMQGQGVGKALVQRVAVEHAAVTLAGTIETTNQRSLQLSLDAGYKQVGELEVRTFTRYRPAARPAYRQAREEDLPQIVRHLRAQKHAWFSPDHLRLQELIVTPDLSSGIQLCPHRWRIPSLGLPGPLDGIARRVLPLLGITPTQFAFATGHYWWGDPGEWGSLLEHGLATLQIQGIVLTGDVRSTFWKDICRSVRFGLVGSAMGSDGMVITSNQAFEQPVHFTPLNAV